MGRKKGKLMMAVCLLLMITGCSSYSSGSKNSTAGELQINRIEVCSAVKNDDRIYHVEYPYYYYAFSTDKCSMYDLDQHIECEDLSREQVQYFIDYISSLPDFSDQENGENISFYIFLTYEDENGESINIYRRGYDTFPDGWEDFIDRYNEILGEEFLTGNGEVQIVTPEFLTDVFDVTDEDVREGTLQDVIDVLELDIKKITDLFYMDDALDGYYAAIKEDEIEPYRPKELVSVESTQEEYDEFIEKYLDAVGLDLSAEIKSDQDYFRRFYVPDTNQYFYTARTGDMDKLPVVEMDGEYYVMDLDAHMEDMTCRVDFVYSADKKYILIPACNDPDMILPFLELK